MRVELACIVMLSANNAKFEPLYETSSREFVGVTGAQKELKRDTIAHLTPLVD